MAKKQIVITRFDGGMSDDIRSQIAGECSVSKHFDVLTFPNRLSPLRGPTALSSSHVIGNMIVGADSNIYGLGTDDGNVTLQQIYKLTDVTNPSWTALATSKSGATVDYNLFVEYKTHLYTWKTGNLVVSDRAGVGSVDNSTISVSHTNTAQGCVHPKTDILYIPYDNIIGTLTGVSSVTVWTAAALTLPSNLKITSICPWGNYLAIATSPIGYTPEGSTLYLWDMVSSDVSEVIPWGTGLLQVINNLDGLIIGISDTAGSTGVADRDSIQFKVYSGGTPQLIKEISTIKQTSTVPSTTINTRVNFKFRNRLYFSMNINCGSTSPSSMGLWSIGKNKTTGAYALTIERMATIDGSETSVIAAAILGDYTLMVYNAEGTVSISNNASSLSSIFTATSSHETNKLTGGDSTQQKRLIGIAVSTVPLPAAGEILTYYRVDADTSWTLISDVTRDNNVGHEDIKINTTGKNLKEFYELQLKFESKGGAEVTGYRVVYEDIKTLLNLK